MKNIFSGGFGGFVKGLNDLMPQDGSAGSASQQGSEDSGYCGYYSPQQNAPQDKSELDDLRKQETDVYIQIGKLAVAQQGPSAFGELSEKLLQIQSEIQAQEQKIMEAELAIQRQEEQRKQADQARAQQEQASNMAASQVLCPQCGSANQPGVKFCQQCGTRMGEPSLCFCSQCGSENPADTRFCGSCGTKLGV